MGNLFGKEKKSPSRINDQDRAVLVRIRQKNTSINDYENQTEDDSSRNYQ